jgi:hypothetical protein
MKLNFEILKVLDVGGDRDQLTSLEAELWAMDMVRYEDKADFFKEHLYSTDREAYEEKLSSISVQSAMLIEEILAKCEKKDCAYFRLLK